MDLFYHGVFMLHAPTHMRCSENLRRGEGVLLRKYLRGDDRQKKHIMTIVIRLLSRIRERVSSQRWGGEPRGIDLAGGCR